MIQYFYLTLVLPRNVEYEFTEACNKSKYYNINCQYRWDSKRRKSDMTRWADTLRWIKLQFNLPNEVIFKKFWAKMTRDKTFNFHNISFNEISSLNKKVHYEYEDYIFYCHYHDIRLDQGNDQLMRYLAIFHDHSQRFLPYNLPTLMDHLYDRHEVTNYHLSLTKKKKDLLQSKLRPNLSFFRIIKFFDAWKHDINKCKSYRYKANQADNNNYDNYQYRIDEFKSLNFFFNDISTIVDPIQK